MNGTDAYPHAWPAAGVGSRPTVRRYGEPPVKRALGAAGFLLDSVSRRRGGRIVIWTLIASMTLSGLGLLMYPFATNVWAGRIQNGLEQKFSAMSGKTPAGFRVGLAEGSALTRLVIPKLRVRVIVVEGTSGNALRAGVGHFPNSALPGDPTGNIVVAGHRTGFGQPFRHVERLREGDPIQLATPYGTYTYRVVGSFDGHANPWITGPGDWSVVSPTPDPSLTLVTCDPPGTSKNRLIVRAQLSSS